ncbi:LOW QUALITY PROTEIN: phospholipid phosphatase-related protein type 4-like [Hippocampus comes]|uniref:LOW QUALITY PROTEIN: phospholipid phosphatase-related protein type 4-like n=1 Tax=Hippocampus comes TaxID=109280 RepID=UPI00094F0D14|nr:PREDICTED: LOW QUALITY PROTEIN: phospholipid phosphatase-related protein type 4-like [Hippocampus comes]
MSAREKAIPSKDSVSLLPCFYFVELPILASSMVSLYFLEWTDLFKPVKSGFNCHDRSLSLPYVDPNHEVIPLPVLLSLAFAGPAVTMMIREAVLFCCLSRRRSGGGGEANLNAAGCHFNSFIRRAIRFVGVHAFGLCATALITDLLQLMTGYPAPYFLTVCKPNYTTLSVSCEQNPYVLQDICSGVDAAAINRGRKSFPSQHATLASFAAVYVSMYFNSTLTDSSKLLKPLLVFSFIICAIVCGLTRIIQYKNHAVDVYLGFLLGGAIAVYLGLYAVGNFLPGEEMSGGGGGGLPAQPHCPTCSLAHISQEAVLHQLQMKAGASGEPGVAGAPSEGLLRRALPQQRADDGLKRSGGDADGISARGPRGKETAVTFSHTLPRVHTPQAIAAYEEAARRHAATLHRDSSRSKQLLSQWKSKTTTSALSSSRPRETSPASPLSTLAITRGPDAAFDAHAYLSKLAAAAGAASPGNCSGIAGGARMLMQSRPGSSQLVHIPEESQENDHSASPKAAAAAAGSDGLSRADAPAQTHWQRVAEKAAACGPNNDQGKKSQPRMVQVMAMSKQQGLLQAHSRSLDESGTGGASQGSARYGGAPCADKEPGGGVGAIVRIEAHPENNKPVIQAPSTDGSGSWRWRSLDHGGAGSGTLRQSFDLGDPGRDSESSDSLREGSLDGKRAHGGDALHHQSLSTIRVTPGDAGGGDAASEMPSLASSRESTLRRKGHSVILIPERGNSPESTRNVFYKGASGPHPE